MSQDLRNKISCLLQKQIVRHIQKMQYIPHSFAKLQSDNL